MCVVPSLERVLSHALRAMEREGQVQAVDPGRLQHHLNGGSLLRRPPDQLPVTACIVREDDPALAGPVLRDGNDEFLCANVDAHIMALHQDLSSSW